MKRYYSFAGVGLALDIPDGSEFGESKELSRFACEPRDGMTECTVRFADNLELPSGRLRVALPNLQEYQCGDTTVRCIGALSQGIESASVVAKYRDGSIEITLKRSVYNRLNAYTLLEAIGAERLVTSAGGVILHSSYIDVGGRAILFTAPSGTGKSTQAELWRENRGATVINGDKSVLRLVDDVPSASGLPYSGSSGISLDRTTPLLAIVYLEQALENTAARLRGTAAFRRVWEGACVNTWNTEMTVAAVDTVGRILSSVPVYLLKCTPDLRAVETLEQVL